MKSASGEALDRIYDKTRVTGSGAQDLWVGVTPRNTEKQTDISVIKQQDNEMKQYLYELETLLHTLPLSSSISKPSESLPRMLLPVMRTVGCFTFAPQLSQSTIKQDALLALHCPTGLVWQLLMNERLQ